MKNKIIILVGPPCSGKSFYTESIITSLNNPFIASTDNIITSLHPELSYNEAFELEKGNFKFLTKKMKEGIIQAVKDNRDIIVDRTNMKSKSRKEFLKMVNDTYEKICVVLDWNKEIFIKRNQERFIKDGKNIPLDLWISFVDSYQKIDKEEGFDKINFIK